MLPASPLDQLAHFVAETRFDDLPATIVAKAKVHILDTLGVALAGTRSREFITVAGMVGAGEGAQIWGTRRTASARDAALANGVAAHVFELDDTGGCDHSGAVVIPAVLAALARAPQPVTGRDLITAIVVGYDVARRLLEAAGGYDTHNGAGWHSTSTCGPIGAAAAVAHLWRLPAEACRHAMTLSTSFASGLWAFIHDGSQAKKIHAGRAAEGGLLAAELARSGFTGPSQVFDEVWGGFFRSFNHAPGDLGKFTEGLGEVWKLARVSLKPYASCRGAHSAVDALSDILAETGRAGAEIAAVDIRLSAMLMGMCGKIETASLAGAQMSLGYAIAARTIFGTAGLDAYPAERRNDPRLGAFCKQIRFTVDTSMQPLDEPVVDVCFQDGSRVSRMVPRATGSPERPMTPTAIEEKFRALAGMALPPVAVDRLHQTVTVLDGLEDALLLESLLAGDPATTAFL